MIYIYTFASRWYILNYYDIHMWNFKEYMWYWLSYPQFFQMQHRPHETKYIPVCFGPHFWYWASYVFNLAYYELLALAQFFFFSKKYRYRVSLKSSDVKHSLEKKHQAGKYKKLSLLRQNHHFEVRNLDYYN